MCTFTPEKVTEEWYENEDPAVLWVCEKSYVLLCRKRVPFPLGAGACSLTPANAQGNMRKHQRSTHCDEEQIWGCFPTPHTPPSPSLTQVTPSAGRILLFPARKVWKQITFCTTPSPRPLPHILKDNTAQIASKSSWRAGEPHLMTPLSP